jgi:peptide/nickel transport system substrate-binding protein
MPSRNLHASFVALLLVLTACSSAGPAAPGGAPPASSSQGTGASAPAARKTLTIAYVQEPPNVEGFSGEAGRGGSGPIKYMVHDYLVQEDDRPGYEPHLAVEAPSTDKGTWKLNSDGTMDMTWTLRPNIKWHDGTPFTSADLVFSFGVYKDPNLPSPFSSTLRLMESAAAPDPQTFTTHWAQTYPFAFQAEGLVPLPKHLLEDLYTRDKDAFVNSGYFNHDWVGLGPYRISKWDAGSQLELTRFDDYYATRPPFDAVNVRFIGDGNTMLANILSGAVDVVLPPSVDLGTALNLRQRWEGTGNQVIVAPTGRMHFMEIQHRPEYAKPTNGLTNQLVRQAFVYATDRQALVDLSTQGIGQVADSYARPADPFRSAVDSAVVQYPYDPARAQQLLTQAGWVKGADSVLVSQQTGERFESELWGRQAAGGQEREPAIVSDLWGKVGAKMTPFVIPPVRESDREFQATLPTIIISSNLGPEEWYMARLNSRNIASAADRWTGRNKLGYSNPRVDQLVDQLQVTIDPTQRNDLHRQLIQLETSDVAYIPLYWEVLPVLALKGVKIPPNSNRTGSNFVAWDRE